MIDLTGITNENEFYTHHYLSAILEEDLKKLYKEWAAKEKEEKERAPYSVLSGSSKKFFILRNQFKNEKDSSKQAKLQREVTRLLLEPLAYTEQPEELVLAEGEILPVFTKISKPNGTPELIVCEVLEDDDETDPLNIEIRLFDGKKHHRYSWEELVTKKIFSLQEPPRWVILVSSKQIILLDRTRWNDKRLLRFNINGILSRKELAAVKAMCALLHKNSLISKVGYSEYSSLSYCNADAECNRMCYIMKTHCIVRIA